MTLKVVLNQEKPIPLDAVFSCNSGEVLALVGPSGSGKSTILRAIAGTYRSLHGAITVNGHCWFDSATGRHLPAHRRAVGMVFQNYALFPHMTALQNVMTAMDHLPRAGRAAKAADLLDLVHLSGLAGRRPAELSGGQQQRVALARALAREPDVLLLDEPFSAVDRATRQRLYDEIAALRRVLSMPVVLVTHDLDEAVALADRMVALHAGCTLQTGTPEKVMCKPVSQAVAQLVRVRNILEGRIVSHDERRSFTAVDWNGRRLRAALAPTFQPGEAVTIAVPDGFISLPQPGQSDPDNAVSGTVESVTLLGTVASVQFRPDGADQPLYFSVPALPGRRRPLRIGTVVTISLIAQGLHLMPHAGHAKRGSPPLQAQDERSANPAMVPRAATMVLKIAAPTRADAPGRRKVAHGPY
jgi:molybdate transport system ATP-binding protein